MIRKEQRRSGEETGIRKGKNKRRTGKIGSIGIIFKLFDCILYFFKKRNSVGSLHQNKSKNKKQNWNAC